MKKAFITQVVCLLMGLTCTIPSVTAQTSSNNKWNAQKASKWYMQKEWQKGLALKPHESTDEVAFATQYHKNKEAWVKAFDFLRTQNLDTLSKGKYTINGDKVFATVTEGPNKDFDKTNWESHRKYIDLQYVIKGKEKIGVAPLATATVTKPYDESKDAANYSAEGKYYVAEPGTFFLFFPADVHRPNIKVDGYNIVKKIVIKIQVTD